MPNVDQERLNLIHQYWNAANYLTIGQIYLQNNPLLKEPSGTGVPHPVSASFMST